MSNVFEGPGPGLGLAGTAGPPRNFESVRTLENLNAHLKYLKTVLREHLGTLKVFQCFPYKRC